MAEGAAGLGFDPEVDLEDDGITPRKGSRLYTSREYWSFRFLREEKKEWLAGSEHCLPIICRLIPADATVLVVGCGNSALSEDLAQTRHFRRIVSTDFSEGVVEMMRSRTAHVAGLEWKYADMLKLEDLGERWDGIVDKGSFDAIVADGGDSWAPPPATSERGRTAARSLSAALQPRGLYVQISFGQPHFRRHFLLPDAAPLPAEKPVLPASPKAKFLGHSPSLHWTVWVEELDVGLGYFVYLCQRDDEP